MIDQSDGVGAQAVQIVGDSEFLANGLAHQLRVLSEVTSVNLAVRVLCYDNPRTGEVKTVSESLTVQEVGDGCSPNQGFGHNHNFLFGTWPSSPSVILLNPDCLPVHGSIESLVRKFEEDSTIGIVEARQWPFEHPKHRDPVTGDTSWASGFFCLLSGPMMNAIGGFDPSYNMYLEDVDLSWTAWQSGFRVVYEPLAVGRHFTQSLFPRRDLLNVEQEMSLRNFLSIAYKFFGRQGFMRAYAMAEKQVSSEVLADATEGAKNDVIPYMRVANRRRHPMVGFSDVLIFEGLRK